MGVCLMFRNNRYGHLFAVVALCLLVFFFSKLLPTSSPLPAAEEKETPDIYGEENPGDHSGGGDPGEENIPEQMPGAHAGQPEQSSAVTNEGSGGVEENKTPNETPQQDDESLIKLLGFLQSPIPGARITSRDSQLPGAPRTYRNGTHEGLDYYDGACGVPIQYGNPVYAAGEGTIYRIDHHYTELAEQERSDILQVSSELDDTPTDILDQLRGQQVWIQHRGNVKTIYAHLRSVAEDLQEGDPVKAGDFIGNIGNSGTSDGMKGTTANAHLHFEIWIGENYLGNGLPAEKTRKLLQELLE